MSKSYDGIRTIGKDKHGKTIHEVNVRYTDPMTGEPKRVYRRCHGTKREATKFRAELLRELEGGLQVADGDKMTFRELAEQWHESRVRSGGFSPDTMDRDEEHMRVCNAYIGNVPVRSVTPYCLQQMYSSIEKDRGLKPSTMRRYHAFISCVLSYAVRQRYITANPEKLTDKPKLGKSDRKSLSQEELSRFAREVDETEREAYERFETKERRKGSDSRKHIDGLTPISRAIAVRVALATGARRGEVLALTWGCVDLEHGRLRICKSLTKSGETKEPKTRAGNRVISIDGTTTGHLATWKAFQAEQLAEIGVEQSGETPVASNEIGGYILPRNFSRWWKGWVAEVGFDGLLFHELRHTMATQLLANGEEIKTVQARGGWASASLLLDVYAHEVPQNDREAANLTEVIMNRPPKDSARGKVVRIGA